MLRTLARSSAVIFLLCGIIVPGLVFSGCSKGPLGGAPMEFACDYQADFVQKIVRAGAATTVMEGNIYTDCELTRTENRMVQPGAPSFVMIMISRPDKGVNWQLFPKSMKYVETPIEPVTDMSEGAPLLINPKDVTVDSEKIGEETVDGHPCIKWKVTTTMPDGKTFVYYSWGAQDLDNFAIKKEFETVPGESMVIEYSNVVLGKPDSSVFEIPAGYVLAPESEMNMLMMTEMGISIPYGMPMMPPMGNQ
ncbi:MAG: hypothetical protein JW765_03610 [Deltaproteobacteria bacterium]|nr:hypothetical protein [Candidatus Zymogenaceae bacterium]